jgi:vancomycin permeability regulator SanA
MHPEWVVIARVSAVVAVVVAITVVVAVVVVATVVGASGVFSLGTSSQMYKSLSSLPAAAHELGL